MLYALQDSQNGLHRAPLMYLEIHYYIYFYILHQTSTIYYSQLFKNTSTITWVAIDLQKGYT